MSFFNEMSGFLQDLDDLQLLSGSFQDIGDKLQLKFKHVRDAFRPLNLERQLGTKNDAIHLGMGAYEDHPRQSVINHKYPGSVYVRI